jgi:hypothetical protein
MSTTAPEGNTPDDDQDPRGPAVGEPRPTGIIPDRASFQHLQAREDAIDYRTARLALPCPNYSSATKPAYATNTDKTPTLTAPVIWLVTCCRLWQAGSAHKTTLLVGHLQVVLAKIRGLFTCEG